MCIPTYTVLTLLLSDSPAGRGTPFLGGPHFPSEEPGTILSITYTRAFSHRHWFLFLGSNHISARNNNVFLLFNYGINTLFFLYITQSFDLSLLYIIFII